MKSQSDNSKRPFLFGQDNEINEDKSHAAQLHMEARTRMDGQSKAVRYARGRSRMSTIKILSLICEFRESKEFSRQLEKLTCCVLRCTIMSGGPFHAHVQTHSLKRYLLF